MRIPIILISGIPACGKSTYGTWLEQKKGFVHLDVEKNEGAVLRSTGLQASWDAMFTTGSAAVFVDDLKELKQPIVLDWGFPPRYIEIVAALKTTRMELWWFDGDRMAAREAFLQRGTLSAAAFKMQMESIDDAWCDIRRLFGSRIVQTVSAGPDFLAPESIFALMFN